MIFFHETAALSPQLAVGLRSLIAGDELLWELQESPCSAAGGSTYQLAQRSKGDSLKFELLASLLRHRFGAQLCASTGSPVEQLHHLTPQVFPVRMLGNPLNPPHQVPHCDNHDFGGGPCVPKFTFVYYVELRNCSGGELVLFDKSHSELHRIVPVQGDLVCISGDQLHAVADLTSGLRTSLVLNLYEPPAQGCDR